MFTTSFIRILGLFLMMEPWRNLWNEGSITIGPKSGQLLIRLGVSWVCWLCRILWAFLLSVERIPFCGRLPGLWMLPANVGVEVPEDRFTAKNVDRAAV